MATTRKKKVASGSDALTAAAGKIGHVLGRTVGTVTSMKDQGEALASNVGKRLVDGEARVVAFSRKVKAKSRAAVKKTLKAATRAARPVAKARKTTKVAVRKVKKAVRKRR